VDSIHTTASSTTIPPQQLQPVIKLSWEYVDPGPLAISGLYSEENIEKLRNHIMFSAEKPALLNKVARRITGSNQC